MPGRADVPIARSYRRPRPLAHPRRIPRLLARREKRERDVDVVSIAAANVCRKLGTPTFGAARGIFLGILLAKVRSWRRSS